MAINIENDEHIVVPCDNSYTSRKFVIVLLGLVLMLAGGIIGAEFPAFIPMYQTFTGGVIGIIAIYLTGNVSEKYVSGKINASVKISAINKSDSSEDVVGKP